MLDIDTDEKLVETLDELSHRLKSLKSPLGLNFRKVLRDFISQQGLDWDQHSFARLPEQGATRGN